MDNLVDIDSLLSGLELESENSPSKRTEKPHDTPLDFVVDERTSNGVTNGKPTSTNNSDNGLGDLLDLSLEPDFGPAPSSLQTTFVDSKRARLPDNLQILSGTNTFQNSNNRCSETLSAPILPFAATSANSGDFNFSSPDLLQINKNDSVETEQLPDKNKGMSGSVVSFSENLLDVPITASQSTSSNATNQDFIQVANNNGLPIDNQGFATNFAYGEQLPYEHNHTKSMVLSDRELNTANRPPLIKPRSAGQSDGLESQFLPLTDDLDFLSSYEGTKLSTNQDNVLALMSKQLITSAAEHSLSLTNTISQLAPQPSAPSFSPEFSLPTVSSETANQTTSAMHQNNEKTLPIHLPNSLPVSTESDRQFDLTNSTQLNFTVPESVQPTLASNRDKHALDFLEDSNPTLHTDIYDTTSTKVLTPTNNFNTAESPTNQATLLKLPTILPGPKPVDSWLHPVAGTAASFHGSNSNHSDTTVATVDHSNKHCDMWQQHDEGKEVTQPMSGELLVAGESHSDGLSSVDVLLGGTSHVNQESASTNHDSTMPHPVMESPSATAPGNNQSVDELNADEEFNSLLAANGYPISQTSPQASDTRDVVNDADLSSPSGYSKTVGATDLASASPNINPLIKNTPITGSVDSFTRLQYADLQQPIDSFTALHNISVSQQLPRNSLLEQNGIVPSTEVEDMGWDIGATHTVVAEDVFADLGLDDVVTPQSQSNGREVEHVGHIDELAPGELPPQSEDLGYAEEEYAAYMEPDSFSTQPEDVSEHQVEEQERMPSTADLQSMVVQDEVEVGGVPDSPHPTDTMPVAGPGPGIAPPPYTERGVPYDPHTMSDPTDGAHAVNGLSHAADSMPPPESSAPPPLAESIEYLDLGATKPYWVPDSEVNACTACQTKFTFTRRRHHCRACGEIFCDSCCKFKSPLQYLDFKEARVCKACHTNIALAAEQQARLFSSQTPEMEQAGAQQAHSTPVGAAGGGAEAAVETPTMPTGVLKDTTSNRPLGSRDPTRTVIFSDGIRPGDDNTHLDGSDVTPSSRVRRKAKNRQKPTHRLRETLRNTFLIPETTLPPLLCYDNDGSRYTAVDAEPDELGLIAKLKEEGDDGRFAFAIHKDLNVEIKIVDMNCCTKRQCWCFTSHGLNTVSQDEVVLLLECLPGENSIPRDVFYLYKMLYQQAAAGKQVTELGYTDLSKVAPFDGEAGFLGSKEHTSLLFIRPTFQCLKGLCLPDPPYLFAILIHAAELPWARLFPVRLKLRLGAEFKYYPCPLMSVRGREAVYGEINNTIMNLLADFHTYKYSLSKIEGFTVHLMDKITTISIPKNMYPAVMQVVGASQECVISFGASFSTQADSHIVCMQNSDGSYSSRTMNIRDQQRTVTGASFVVLSGSMKESYGMSAKCSIVEDGIMVQITKEALEEFKAKLKNMQEYTVTCGRTDDSREQNEQVQIIWVDDYKDYNIGVVSPIDDFPLDGVMSLRVKSFNDVTHDSFTIRWTEVFFVQVDESRLSMDTMEITQFSETVANSTCSALAPFLTQLHDQGMKKVALRVTLGPEQVEYICGSLGQRLTPNLMNNLDGELVPVLHSAAAAIGSSLLILELVFHVLE